MKEFKDYPLDKVVTEVNARISAIIAGGGTAYVHQKWTCRHCGSRQTMADRNTFHRSGRCEECNQITIIDKCNYLFVMGRIG